MTFAMQVFQRLRSYGVVGVMLCHDSAEASYQQRHVIFPRRTSRCSE